MWNEILKQKIIKIFILGLLPILFFNLTLLIKEEMRSGFVSKRLGIEYNKDRSKKFFREYNKKYDFVLIPLKDFHLLKKHSIDLTCNDIQKPSMYQYQFYWFFLCRFLILVKQD